MKTLIENLVDLFTNQTEKRLIARMEILKNAMYANTPTELRFYLNQLNTL